MSNDWLQHVAIIHDGIFDDDWSIQGSEEQLDEIMRLARSANESGERAYALERALTDVLNSEVVKQAPFAGYSEALARARSVLSRQEVSSPVSTSAQKDSVTSLAQATRDHQAHWGYEAEDSRDCPLCVATTVTTISNNAPGVCFNHPRLGIRCACAKCAGDVAAQAEDSHE